MKITILMIAFTCAGFVDEAGYSNFALGIIGFSLLEFMYEAIWEPYKAKRLKS